MTTEHKPTSVLQPFFMAKGEVDVELPKGVRVWASMLFHPPRLRIGIEMKNDTDENLHALYRETLAAIAGSLVAPKDEMTHGI